METQAVAFLRPEEVALRTFEMPPPAEDELQIRTSVSTISAGTEGWILRNLFTWSPTPFPCVPGYQRVGTVTVVGSKATGWRVGESVMAVLGRWPGSPSSFWGAHLALANTPLDFLFRLPEKMDDLEASGAVVAQVGYNAASRATLNKDDWVVVYGDGLIGQCAAQSTRARGNRVVLVGHRKERLTLGAAHSANAVVNARQEDVVEAVRAATGKQTVAAILDSVQTVESQSQYIELLERRQGQIVYCGFTPGQAWTDMGLLQQRELTTHFVSGWTRARMEATFALMASGKIRLRPLISHLVPHNRAPEMYQMIAKKSEPFLGIALDWKGAT